MAGWIISDWAVALSSGLNGLAGGAQVTSATITPPTSPDRPFYLDGRVLLGSLTPQAGQALAIHVLPAVNDLATLFADLNSMTREWEMPLNSGNTNKYSYLKPVWCPVVPFRIAVVNSVSGTALGTGNLIEYMTRTEG